MPNWDEDSPELRQNLAGILEEITDRADQREIPTKERARNWQRRMMQGLAVEPRYVGAFRGEPGLERTGVKIGDYFGTRARQVAEELEAFDRTLQKTVAELDQALPVERSSMLMNAARSSTSAHGLTRSG